MQLALWSAEAGYGTLSQGAAVFVQRNWRAHRDRLKVFELREKLRVERIIAAETAESECSTTGNAPVERVADEKVKIAFVAAETANTERLAAKKLQVDYAAAEKAEAERIEAKLIAAENVEIEHIIAKKAEVEAKHVAAEKVKAEFMEAEKAKAQCMTEKTKQMHETWCNAAARKIQSYFKGYKAVKSAKLVLEKKSQQHLQDHAVVIQRCFKAFLKHHQSLRKQRRHELGILTNSLSALNKLASMVLEFPKPDEGKQVNISIQEQIKVCAAIRIDITNGLLK